MKLTFLFSSVCPLLGISSSTGRAQLMLMPDLPMRFSSRSLTKKSKPLL